MPAIFTESTFEQAIIELFENMGYTHIYAPDLNRTDYTRPLLDEHLRDSLVRVNWTAGAFCKRTGSLPTGCKTASR